MWMWAVKKEDPNYLMKITILNLNICWMSWRITILPSLIGWIKESREKSLLIVQLVWLISSLKHSRWKFINLLIIIFMILTVLLIIIALKILIILLIILILWKLIL